MRKKEASFQISVKKKKKADVRLFINKNCNNKKVGKKDVPTNMYHARGTVHKSEGENLN